MVSQEILDLTERLYSVVGRTTYTATKQGTVRYSAFTPDEKHRLLMEVERLINYWIAYNKHHFIGFTVEDLRLVPRLDEAENELVFDFSERMKRFFRGEIEVPKMKNDNAKAAGERLMTKVNRTRDDFIHSGMELSDELLASLRDRLQVVYLNWLIDEGFQDIPFFRQKGVQLIVIRRSTTEFEVGLSEKLRHWSEGLMNEDYQYYIQPTVPKIPPHNKINIGLDWDHTFTEDIEGWYLFVKLMISRGHDVHIVTMRYEEECLDIPQVIKDLVTGVWPTSRQAKNAFMCEKGISIDVWIDDNPKAIYMDAAQAFGHSTPKGVVVSEQSHDGN